jgi:hypothetical protein
MFNIPSEEKKKKKKKIYAQHKFVEEVVMDLHTSRRIVIIDGLRPR